jgi:hypothetical protein
MSFGAPVDDPSFRGVEPVSPSFVLGEADSGTGCGAISRFFLSSNAFINRAFSGVIVGIFGNVAVLGEAADFIDTPELVAGLPPLVCGLVEGICKVPAVVSGTGGGEIVMPGGSADICDFDLSLSFLDPRENNFNPAGSVETGR